MWKVHPTNGLSLLHPTQCSNSSSVLNGMAGKYKMW